MNDFSRRRFLYNGLLLAGNGLALSVLGGCGPNDNARTHALSAAALSSQASSTIPQPGGKIRIGVISGNQIGNLDAHKPLGGGGASFRGWALYSKLWEWNLDANPGLGLAESAEVNKDGTEWIIRLQKGLEFHHGKSITADDVIFSLLRLTDPQLASPYAAYLYSLERNNIRKLDDLTVSIPFAKERGFIALPECWMSWGGIVPTDYDPVTNVVGAGPYRLKSFTPGQRSTFTRFENYYKPGQPYADEIEIIDFLDQTSRLQALQAGQIDIASGITQEQLPFLQQDKRFKVINSEADVWHSFDMNTEKAPFNDVRVRQAFRLLANREELVARVLHGHGRVANDIYAPSDPTFNHHIPQRQQDIVAAKALLEQAGFAEGELEVELVTTTGTGLNSAIVFSQQAQKAGVKITVKQVDPSIFSGPKRNDWAFSTGGGVSRPFLLSVQQHDGPYAANNKTHFKDDRFSELITAAMSQPDLSKRRELVYEAQQIQHDIGGLLIWGYSNVLDAATQQIGGIEPDRTGFASWRTDKLWVNSI